MKKLHNLASICMAVAMVSTVFSAEPVKIVGDFLPEGVLVSGTIINVQYDKELPDMLRKFDEASAKLPKETQEELRKLVKPGYPVPFDERFGVSKEDYDKYIETWNKRRIVDVAPVVIGLMPAEEKGIYKLASSTQRGPLPLSTLRFDSNKDVWTSPNGELNRRDDLVFTEQNNLGAWKAHEWMNETKTSFDQTAENVLIGKTDDGKYIYFIYNFLNVTSLGTPVDNKTVVIRIPVESTKSGDPLLDKARQGSGQSL